MSYSYKIKIENTENNEKVFLIPGGGQAHKKCQNVTLRQGIPFLKVTF